MWRFKPALNPTVAAKQELEDKWALQPACTIDGSPIGLTVNDRQFLSGKFFRI